MNAGPYPPVDAGQPPSGPLYAYWLNVTPGRVRGAVSDFREGAITLGPAGVQVDGKAILPGWQRALIMLGSLLLCIGPIPAAIVLEYAVRVRRRLEVPWASLEDVVLEARRSRACLVYRPVADVPKVESLAFKLPPEQYPHFRQVVDYLAPGKAREGKIGGPTSLAALLIVVVVLVAIIAVVFWAASRP